MTYQKPQTNERADEIFRTAADTVCKGRSALHGDTAESFQAIADFWQLYLRQRHSTRTNIGIVITKVDVAQMMSLLKKVRYIYGDQGNPENFVDDVGFVGIAGMLQGIGIPATPIETPANVRNEGYLGTITNAPAPKLKWPVPTNGPAEFKGM